jgi:hypothetical protein
LLVDQLPACADCLFFQPSGSQLRCPNGSSVKETIPLPNLWTQVQKPSKFVDFTRIGALLRLLNVNHGISSRSVPF